MHDHVKRLVSMHECRSCPLQEWNHYSRSVVTRLHQVRHDSGWLYSQEIQTQRPQRCRKTDEKVKWGNQEIIYCRVPL